MVVEGLFCHISHSLQFFADNMEWWPNQAPLFETRLVLSSSSGMVFQPSLERDAGDGLYELVEGLLADIFKTSMCVKRVAADLDTESYQVLVQIKISPAFGQRLFLTFSIHQDVMDDMMDLSDLRQEIMDRVENVLEKAKTYQEKFDCYEHLWLDNRTKVLGQFLVYGRVLTAEEMEACAADLLPESPPSIQNFREQAKHLKKYI